MKAFHEMRERDVMDKKFISLRADTDVYEAMRLIVDNGLMGAPVVEHNRLIGVFSEKDCFKVLSGWLFQMGNATGGKVSDFMTTEVVTVDADMDLSMLTSRFLTHYYRGLPVVENDELVGLISRGHLVGVMMREADTQSTARYPDYKYGEGISS